MTIHYRYNYKGHNSFKFVIITSLYWNSITVLQQFNLKHNSNSKLPPYPIRLQFITLLYNVNEKKEDPPFHCPCLSLGRLSSTPSLLQVRFKVSVTFFIKTIHYWYSNSLIFLILLETKKTCCIVQQGCSQQPTCLRRWNSYGPHKVALAHDTTW